MVNQAVLSREQNTLNAPLIDRCHCARTGSSFEFHQLAKEQPASPLWPAPSEIPVPFADKDPKNSSKEAEWRRYPDWRGCHLTVNRDALFNSMELELDLEGKPCRSRKRTADEKNAGEGPVIMTVNKLIHEAQVVRACAHLSWSLSLVC